jgi:hypothetical protein
VPDVLTASPSATWANVLLRTEFTATASQTATVERSSDGGVTWTAVRGSPITLVGPDPSAGSRIGYVYDSEAPFNTALRYRSTSNLGVVTTDGPVTVTVAAGVSWLKDPARPWANLRLDECTPTPVPYSCDPPASEPAINLVASGLLDETRAGDFTLFPVLNRPRPADVFAYRKDVVTSWQVVSKTLTSMNSLTTFYAWGGPIFIQLPPEYGWPDRYYQPGDTKTSRLSYDLRQPYRLWDVPLTVVDSPVGAAQGQATNNWCVVDAQYATYAQMAASGLTWSQVVEGAAAPAALSGYGSGIYGGPPVYGG